MVKPDITQLLNNSQPLILHTRLFELERIAPLQDLKGMQHGSPWVQPMPLAYQKATDGLLGAGQERLDRFGRERRGSSRQELSRSNAALTFASSSASGADPSRSKASAALLRAAAACASRHGPPFSCLNLLYASA